uniref:Uncharacterized protein n=1 Tax=Glossina brevipalpis TaxID=37001 RepID=A0A1A9WEI2_9MUSC
MIYEDFSTSPFNSPITSPASKLKALEQSPLFILLEKPKRSYGRKFKKKMRTKLEEKPEFIVNYDDNSDEEDLVPIEDTLTGEQLVALNSKKSEASHRDCGDIGEEERFKVKQTLVPSNHGKSDTGKNDHWDVFASIDIQQIVKQNEQAEQVLLIYLCSH